MIMQNATTSSFFPNGNGNGYREPTSPKMRIRDLAFYYGEHQALQHINLDIAEHQVTAFIGPSGCGKSTLLRVLNRIYELYPGHRVVGEVLLDHTNILSSSINVDQLRRRIGMVFQKPTPFPMSIYDNVAFGIRLNEHPSKSTLDDRVEEALTDAALWDEVKKKLNKSGASLSGGQQQRLCIARTIAVRPEVVLLDEPTSALDPRATAKIEELILKLREKYTIAIVTHNMQQAARISDFTAFMYLGALVEYGETERMFTKPEKEQTENYITGRFG